MSYCVNCGVELGAGAGSCPLCHTPVQNPHTVPDKDAPPFFPTRHEGVEPSPAAWPGCCSAPCWPRWRSAAAY